MEKKKTVKKKTTKSATKTATKTQSKTKVQNKAKTLNNSKKKKNNKKGFTLIELLAVIIILGVLMIIAIPSVTNYISDSRKNAYIDTAKELISGARTLVNSGKLETYDRNTTYYIPTACVSTENGAQSPYGKFDVAYIGVIYTGDGYQYYWVSKDSAGQGVKTITAADKLTIDLIESNIDDLEISQQVQNTAIDGRGTILILSGDCKTWEGERIANNNLGPDGKIGPMPIHFKLNNQYYDFAEGMTWGQWLASDYNTIGAVKHEVLDLIYTRAEGWTCNWISTIYNYYVIAINNNPVTIDDLIIRDATYVNEWDSCTYLQNDDEWHSCTYGMNSAC